MYRKEIFINLDNVRPVLAGAHFLMTPRSMKPCAQYLSTHDTADSCATVEMSQLASPCALSQLRERMAGEQFSSMAADAPKELLVELLRGDCIDVNSKDCIVRA